MKLIDTRITVIGSRIENDAQYEKELAVIEKFDEDLQDYARQIFEEIPKALREKFRISLGCSSGESSSRVDDSQRESPARVKQLAELVKQSIMLAEDQVGIAALAPHDLRRTCARLCRSAGGELDQIQLLLGHVSIQTTEQ